MDAQEHTSTSRPPENDHKLADDLKALLVASEGKAVTLERLIELLGDRGHAMLIVLLTAPFLVLPIPGISTAFGFAIFLLGGCVMLGVRPWLPKFIARREISHQSLEKLVGKVSALLRRLERILKPRLTALTHRAWHWSIGLSLCAAAVALALPIPIPWNNVPPAIVLMFLALGLLERDGIALIVGHVLNVVLWIILYFMGDFLINTVQNLWQRIT